MKKTFLIFICLIGLICLIRRPVSAAPGDMTSGIVILGEEELVYNSPVDALPDYPYFVFESNGLYTGIISYTKGYKFTGNPFATNLSQVTPIPGLVSNSVFDAGTVLLVAIYKSSNGVFHGFYHAERVNGGQPWSSAYIRSTDGGASWFIPDNFKADNRILTGFDGGGTDPYSTIQIGEYLYQYYFEHAAVGGDPLMRGLTVARAPIASEGKPGNWMKYYCQLNGSCGFTEPGFGGRFTPINFSGQMWATKNNYLDKYIGIDAWPAWNNNEIIFKFSEDAIQWLNLAKFTIPPAAPDPSCTDPEICSPPPKWHPDNRWHYAYMSLVAPNQQNSSQETGRTFYLYYVKLNFNSLKRYLARRKVEVTGSSPFDGDANGNGAVNAQDLKVVLKNYLQTVTLILDQYPDQKINALDFVTVMKRLP